MPWCMLSRSWLAAIVVVALVLRVVCVAQYETRHPLAQRPVIGLDVNVRGVVNMLEACRWRGVKKIVYSSSIAAYGNQTTGVVSEKGLGKVDVNDLGIVVNNGTWGVK